MKRRKNARAHLLLAAAVGGVLNCAADGHYGCQLKETGNSVRRRFLGSSSDELVLA